MDVRSMRYQSCGIRGYVQGVLFRVGAVALGVLFAQVLNPSAVATLVYCLFAPFTRYVLSQGLCAR